MIEWTRDDVMQIIQSPYHLCVQRHDIGFELHTHDTMVEIELLVSGSGFQILNGRRYSIQKGSLWITRPQDFHEVNVPKGVNILNIQFKPSILSRDLLSLLLDHPNDICIQLSEEDFSVILHTAETILEEHELQNDFSDLIAKRQIELMLLRVFRILSIQPIEKKNHTENSLIEKAILFLRTNFSENPSLDATASFVHLNADYFAVQFKKYIGRTYYAYLTELKMEYAKKLILETDLKLSTVCFKCGFGDQSNFLRQFKRYFGCTPTQMRQKKIGWNL